MISASADGAAAPVPNLQLVLRRIHQQATLGAGDDVDSAAAATSASSLTDTFPASHSNLSPSAMTKAFTARFLHVQGTLFTNIGWVFDELCTVVVETERTSFPPHSLENIPAEMELMVESMELQLYNNSLDGFRLFRLVLISLYSFHNTVAKLDEEARSSDRVSFAAHSSGSRSSFIALFALSRFVRRWTRWEGGSCEVGQYSQH